ncbi:MAG: nuclear transport factor 2 family protein [Terriglobales bacterium]|jgi:ketosteroid isomerase-like protein
MEMGADDNCADAAIQTAKAIFAAFVAKDRNAAENLIADKFSFTSPLDNGLDRKAYFSICWPNSENMKSVKFCQIYRDKDRVFVTYEADSSNGRRFRNTEILTVNEGKISAVEVYFGWNVPHEVPRGEHRDP